MRVVKISFCKGRELKEVRLELVALVVKLIHLVLFNVVAFQGYNSPDMDVISEGIWVPFNDPKILFLRFF